VVAFFAEWWLELTSANRQEQNTDLDFEESQKAAESPNMSEIFFLPIKIQIGFTEVQLSLPVQL
jgi:hypothetical protein